MPMDKKRLQQLAGVIASNEKPKMLTEQERVEAMHTQNKDKVVDVLTSVCESLRRCQKQVNTVEDAAKDLGCGEKFDSCERELSDAIKCFDQLVKQVEKC